MIDRLRHSILRFFSLFRRTRLDCDLDADLASHLETQIEVPGHMD